MAFKSGEIDPKLVRPPVVLMTKRAREQLKLIEENDYTLDDLVFRIEISGKNCDGFTYAAGFTPVREDDFIVPVENAEGLLCVHLDPFAAHYLHETSVDFIQDFEQEAEGFVVINLQQERFAGKFWRANPELTPPLKEESP
jgi:iron-sulfur cluster insertion protein